MEYVLDVTGEPVTVRGQIHNAPTARREHSQSLFQTSNGPRDVLNAKSRGRHLEDDKLVTPNGPAHCDVQFPYGEIPVARIVQRHQSSECEFLGTHIGEGIMEPERAEELAPEELNWWLGTTLGMTLVLCLHCVFEVPSSPGISRVSL